MPSQQAESAVPVHSVEMDLFPDVMVTAHMPMSSQPSEKAQPLVLGEEGRLPEIPGLPHWTDPIKHPANSTEAPLEASVRQTASQSGATAEPNSHYQDTDVPQMLLQGSNCHEHIGSEPRASLDAPYLLAAASAGEEAAKDFDQDACILEGAQAEDIPEGIDGGKRTSHNFNQLLKDPFSETFPTSLIAPITEEIEPEEWDMFQDPSSALPHGDLNACRGECSHQNDLEKSVESEENFPDLTFMLSSELSMPGALPE